MTSYYAKIENDLVNQVIVADKAFIDSLEGSWIETDPENKIHKNYAGIGYGWDGNGFFPPKCHNEAQLNKDTYLWDCPDPIHSAPIIGDINANN